MSGKSRSHYRLLWFAGCVTFAIVALSLAFLVPTKPVVSEKSADLKTKLARCRKAMTRKDWSQAALIAEKILDEQPDSVPALLMHGQALAMQGRIDSALKSFDQLPDSQTKTVVSGKLLAISLLIESGHLTDAIKRLEPLRFHSPQARSQLAYLLAITGQKIAAREVLMTTLSDPLPLQHFFWVAFPESVAGEQARISLEQWRSLPNPEPLVLTGLACWHLSEREPHRAIPLLEQAASRRESQELLGSALLKTDQKQNLRHWAQNFSMPPTTPEGWKVIGELALKQQWRRQAARAFLEAVKLDPQDADAAYQAGHLLVELDNPSIGNALLERAQKLRSLKSYVEELSEGEQSVDKFCAAIDLLIDLGRLQEADVWARFALQAAPQSSAVRTLSSRLQSVSAGSATAASLLWNPIAELDIAAYKVPDLKLGTESPNPAPNNAIKFINDAEVAGLNFKFENGHDPSQTAMLMHEFTGGGVGVIDFDRDGWSDLYFPQGGKLPNGPKNKLTENISDQLFRNIEGTRFQNRTAQAGISEVIFGQGICVGDVDQDGFPDLYVGNIGTNALWMNNGDGTFTNVSDSFSPTLDDWTTSCVLADLTGDGLPDIYDVTYLQGKNVYTEICRDNEQIARSCKPTEFSAAPDRFWVNLGNGQFEERAGKHGLVAPEGRGLGAVAFHVKDSSLPSLFVANDGEPNFYFERNPASQDQISYHETALTKGLAYDANGEAQACMGIAAEDINADGEIDLFVTNYYRESNTLYVRNSFGSYDDLTAGHGLYESSLSVLGFGTQFADWNRDGAEDLIVTNGHEGDYSDLDIPFQMRPQVYQGSPSYQFQEVPGTMTGSYFQREYLGRGVARLDWNRDGLEDVCITHLDAPVALLTNQSATQSNWISLTLIGTQSEREGTFARVSIRAGTKTSQRQLLTGGGYLSENERRLQFSTNRSPHVDTITIHWNSGHVDEFSGPFPANQSYFAIENQNVLAESPIP